jgi:hypothetical protein
MALDPTAREANLRDSIKKYMVDNLATIESLNLSFDSTLATPLLSDKSVDKWVIVNFGSMHRGDMSMTTLEIFCCTRKDNEGFKLAQLVDTVMGYLTVSTGDDSTCRIPFYRSYPSQPWENIGGIVVQDIFESEQLLAEDDTKYKILTVVLRFASKV